MTMRTLAVVAALSTAPAAARADEPVPPDEIPAKARSLAEHGRAFHDAGDYGNAIIAFKEAYVMAPSPGLLFNLAQAYRLQGNCDDAAMMYRRYLATGPSTDGRTLAEGHLGSVERCAHDPAQRAGAPGAGLAIHTDRRSGSLFATSPAVARGRLQKNVGLVLGVGGGLALSIALYHGLRARDAAATVERGYANGARWKDLADIDARGERSATYAAIFGIGGGIAVLGGVSLYLLGRHTERIAPITVSSTPHGAQVSVAWRF